MVQNNSIKPFDISVIVQGAIDKIETPKCLASIRTHLPNAEIILSTWENSKTEGLDYDTLILNKDPGGVLLEEYKSKVIYNNLNRQLLSTQEGLKSATRKYTLKLRSDLIITNTTFLENYNLYPQRINDYRLFEHKILVPTLLTRYYYRANNNRTKMPFHISDWWFFGLTTDIKKYFENTPLVQEPDFTNYFKKEANKTKKNPYGKIMHKFAPEQYFALSAFSKAFDDIKMIDASDYSEELMEKFKKCLLNNFIVLDFKQSGIYLNKYSFSKNEKFIGDQYIDLYNPYRFQKDYKEVCDNDFIITAKPVLEDKKTYALMRIYKHIHKLIDPNTKLLRRLMELFIVIPISLCNYIKILLIRQKG